MRYVSDRDQTIGTSALPTGTITVGSYSQHTPYTTWRMTAPYGSLIGHRFDVITDVFIRSDEVEYTDLTLDVWVENDGESQILEADELEHQFRCDLIDRADVQHIRRVANGIIAGFQDIIHSFLNAQCGLNRCHRDLNETHGTIETRTRGDQA